MTTATPLVLSADEAAEALRVSRRTIFNWTRAGDIPHVRRGSRTFYPVAALNEWIARDTVSQGPREGRADG